MKKISSRSNAVTGCVLALVLAGLGGLAGGCAIIDDGASSGGTAVTVGDEVIHNARGVVTDLKTITVEGTSIRIATWNETFQGVTEPFFAINLGRGWNEAKKTSYDVPLRARRIDPAHEAQSITLERDGTDLHIVQYVAQPLDAFWKAIRAAGGEVEQYVHGNAQLVRGDVRVMQRIARLSFVRAITPLRSADKLEPGVDRLDPRARLDVSILLVDPKRDRPAVESAITGLGGKVLVSDPRGVLIEANLTAADMVRLADLPEVLWVERLLPMENDYDIARQQGGADFLEALADNGDPPVPGYTGIGIRGHILEGINPNHAEFAANEYRTIPVAVDLDRPDSHGMQTFGIVFASGVGNARAKGALPNGQGFYTHNQQLVSDTGSGRATLVAKLIAEHKVMFQTASWGNNLIKTYTAKSAEMDALILANDIPITQSQSNTGNQSSRPQAWAKNIISVGAFNHMGTAALEDDKWRQSGSIGPAADGSIKPDLAFYYDKTITTSLNGYSNNFGGTSGATPTVAGYVGLTIEMWTNGAFGNQLLPLAAGEDITSFRFKNRPHFTTTKALLIHSAKQYAFEGLTHDMTRTHQGWGVPDVAGMFQRRSNILVVNETDVLRALDRKVYSFEVPKGAPDFRATMIYADKEATVPATIHRINNLDLKVTAPDGTVYWGNNGLLAGMFSTSGGEHDVLNTVENILIQAPAAGTWTVEVIADEINADTHPETEEADSAYALVVSSGPQ